MASQMALAVTTRFADGNPCGSVPLAQAQCALAAEQQTAALKEREAKASVLEVEVRANSLIF